jgi:hypothetical protein
MANEIITYSNGCSPQELEATGVRWYRDSDIGKKLSGKANIAMGSGSLVYVASKLITSNESVLSAKDFIFVRNISGSDVKVSFDNGANFLIALSSGESFASELDSSVANVIIGTDGTSEIEYLSGT